MEMIHQEDAMFCVRVARLLSARSRASRLRVGCVIWDSKKRTIVSVGYNGTVPGASNVMEVDNVTLPEVIHAEMNAISKLSFIQRRFFSHRYIMFITHSPCASCASNILKNTNIRYIYYLENYRSMSGVTMLRNHKKIRKISRLIPR